jgi:hypothetical protein
MTRAIKRDRLTSYPIAKQIGIEDAARDIHERSALQAESIGYACSSFLAAALPQVQHTGCTYERRSGAWSLRIDADPELGMPYGRAARILMLWLTRQCVVSPDVTLDIGGSYHRFLRHHLCIGSSGGANGSLSRYATQADRLFQSTISVRRSLRGQVVSAEGMRVTESLDAIGHGGAIEQGVMGSAQLKIGIAFHQECRRHAFPIDLRVVSGLRSNRALDLYLLLAYRLPQLSKPITLRWEHLRAHLGSQAKLDSGPQRGAFKSEIQACLKDVQVLYSAAHVTCVHEGLMLLPSPPSVSRTRIC